VDQAAGDRLRVFAELLTRWNATINLVSRGDLKVLWPRHIEDSLQLGTLCGPLPPRLIDLGSGAGFPGLILSIAFGVQADLIEEDKRKAAFLREAARVTAAPAVVHAVNIRDARVQPAPLVTARALAPLPRLLEYAAPLLAPGGDCWFLKSRDVDAELMAAERDWNLSASRIAGLTSPDGIILRVSGLTRRADAV